MNEASVLRDFTSGLRKALPGSEVIKLHDASFIGLPDVTVAFEKQSFWIEGKFVEMKRKWLKFSDDQIVQEIFDSVLQKSASQNEMLKRLSRCASAIYIIWVKKTCVYFVTPTGHLLERVESTKDAVDWFIGHIAVPSN